MKVKFTKRQKEMIEELADAYASYDRQSRVSRDTVDQKTCFGRTVLWLNQCQLRTGIQLVRTEELSDALGLELTVLKEMGDE